MKNASFGKTKTANVKAAASEGKQPNKTKNHTLKEGKPSSMKSPSYEYPHQNVSYAGKKSGKSVDIKCGHDAKARNLLSENKTASKYAAVHNKLSLIGPDQGPIQHEGKEKKQHPRKLSGG